MRTQATTDSPYPIYRKHAASGHPGDLRGWYGAPHAINVRTGRSFRVHKVHPSRYGAATLAPACGATLGTRTARTASTAPVNCPSCLAL